MNKHLYVKQNIIAAKSFAMLFAVISGEIFGKICCRWLLKTGGLLMQCQTIVKFVERILYLLLYASGRLFQVVIRTSLTEKGKIIEP